MPGDIGLQWKLVQQSFAKGVNRLDLQPARRFQRSREEPPRLMDLRKRRTLPLDRLDALLERRVIERRPFASRSNTRFDISEAAAFV